MGTESNRDLAHHEFLLDQEINQIERELKIDNKIHKSELVQMDLSGYQNSMIRNMPK